MLGLKKGRLLPFPLLYSKCINSSGIVPFLSNSSPSVVNLDLLQSIRYNLEFHYLRRSLFLRTSPVLREGKVVAEWIVPRCKLVPRVQLFSHPEHSPGGGPHNTQPTARSGRIRDLAAINYSF